MLRWVHGDGASRLESSHTATILIIGSGDYKSFVQCIQDLIQNHERNYDAENIDPSDTSVKSGFTVEIITISTLDMDGSAAELTKRGIDYIIIMVDPSDPTCLDKVETECLYIDLLFTSRRRIEFCLWRDFNTFPQILHCQLQPFTTRYLNPAVSSINYNDNESIKVNAEIIYNRLKFIRSCSDTNCQHPTSTIN